MKPELSYDDRVQTVHDSDEMKKLKERNSGNVNNKTVTGTKRQDTLFNQGSTKSKNSHKFMNLKRKYSGGKVFDQNLKSTVRGSEDLMNMTSRSSRNMANQANTNKSNNLDLVAVTNMDYLQKDTVG